ncbi:hypothetical protein ACFTZB_29900 [Rhodococcus sp. NPDC057014]|uniref:hypothetical protein n=1 Tax=Rhodococcus sp. NPDC057014 TaxID=3346000 RepID=UPI00362C07BC
MVARKQLTIDSITCLSKTNPERYVDYITVILVTKKRTPEGYVPVYATSVVLGDRSNTNSIPKFRNGTKLRFEDWPELLPVHVTSRDSADGSISEEPVRPITVGDRTAGKDAQSPDDYTVDITLINDRDVDDPYILAKALMIIGGIGASALAGYGVSKIGPGNEGDLIDLAKKALSSGAAKSIYGELMEAISDIFKDWPHCAGRVFHQTVSLQDTSGIITLRTDPGASWPGGCGRPDYEVQLTLEVTGLGLDDYPKPKRMCEIVPFLTQSVEDWSATNGHVLLGFEEPQPGHTSPITVSFFKEIGGGQPGNTGTLFIAERSKSTKGYIVNYTNRSITPTLGEVQTRRNGVKFVQGDFLIKDLPAASKGRIVKILENVVGQFPSKPKKFGTIDSPIVQHAKKLAEELTSALWKQRGPEWGAIIEIPEIDVRLELHRRICYDVVDGKKVEGSAASRGNVIFYFRGYSKPNGEGDYASDTAAMLVPLNPKK